MDADALTRRRGAGRLCAVCSACEPGASVGMAQGAVRCRPGRTAAQRRSAGAGRRLHPVCACLRQLTPYAWPALGRLSALRCPRGSAWLRGCLPESPLCSRRGVGARRTRALGRSLLSKSSCGASARL